MTITEARKLVDNDADAKVLGIGAVKYADLSCNRIKDYTFSYERMLKFEGNTVVFILYAFVRIQSLLRKFGSDNAPIAIEHPSEIALGLHLARFGEALHAMDEELLPHKLTDYLYTLAEKFHLFFRDCHIEGSSQKQSRLSLCILTARVIEKGLFLLGIKTLEKL